MSDTKKTTLRTVENNWDEINEKIKAYRRRRLRRILLAAIICAAFIVALFLYMRYMTYDQIRTTDAISRNDTQGTQYDAFGEYILRFSNDGITCMDSNLKAVWAQAFSMQSPIVRTSENYVIAADRNGKNFYIIGKDGEVGNYQTDMQITQVCVSDKGTAAILMQNADTGYLCVYDAGGNKTAEGAIHAEGSGYPVDLALSPDGKTLAVSILTVADGQIQSSIHYYNFGEAGAAQPDHRIAAYDYPGTIIPQIQYIRDDILAAYGDNRLLLIEGSEKPKQRAEILFKNEVKSIFSDHSGIGVLFDRGGEGGKDLLQIYDTDASVKMEMTTSQTYDTAYYLDNGEIFLCGTGQAAICTDFGRQKYAGTLPKDPERVYSTGSYGKYVFVYEDQIEVTRLALAGGTKTASGER